MAVVLSPEPVADPVDPLTQWLDGECERGNYAREMPGWDVDAVSSGLYGRQHTIKIITPPATAI